MKIRPVPGCTANVNGLRSPSVQIARYLSLVRSMKGLSGGMVPSALIRNS
jgi:hypothetical protein